MRKPAASAASSSAPFFSPAHDCCLTVRTSWPTKRGASCRGSCSSSRTRTRHHRFMRGFQRGNRLLSRHGWKGVQEFVEAVIARQIVDEVSKGNPGADEDGRTPQDFRVAVNDARAARHWKPLKRFYAASL